MMVMSSLYYNDGDVFAILQLMVKCLHYITLMIIVMSSLYYIDDGDVFAIYYSILH